MRTLTSTLVLALFAAAPAAAQDFSWSERIAQGQTLEIKGVNGEIRALAAGGDRAAVEARKSGRRSDPRDVTIEVVEHAGGVTICAVYPTPRNARRDNECAPGRGGSMSTRNNDVEVDFVVRVPAGVQLVGRTVNGDVEAEGLRSDVAMHTVNGDVRVTTAGHAEANTVNGSIHVDMGRADWDGDLRFKTVNGSITVVFPEQLGAELSAKTVNGSIESDFPMTVQGRVSRTRLNAVIGAGGRPLHLETVNGSIRLRRR